MGSICTDQSPFNSDTLENQDLEKSKIFKAEEILEYVHQSVVTKTIIRRATGNVTAVSFDSGAVMKERTTPFDTFIQIIEGKAEISIDGKTYLLATGQSIIIPSHRRNSFVANERFKMISTTIKSGYEEVI